MQWNNAREKARFEKEQKELREEYLKAGMTEEQIQTMYYYDLEQMNCDRREAEHTQELDFDSENFLDKETDNPLLQKFGEKITTGMDKDSFSRYEWIEEIEDEHLYLFFKRLPIEDLELITLIYKEKYRQSDIAKYFSISQQAISKKLKKIRKKLKDWL